MNTHIVKIIPLFLAFFVLNAALPANAQKGLRSTRRAFKAAKVKVNPVLPAETAAARAVQQAAALNSGKIAAQTAKINAKLAAQTQATGQALSRRMPMSPHQHIKALLKGNKNPIEALRQWWALTDQYHKPNMFEAFASTYYKNHFYILTPHLTQLFKRVEQQNNRDLELRFLKRLRFLAENRTQFQKVFSPNAHQATLRVRFTNDISRLTAKNFNARDLVFSFEKFLTPKHPKHGIRHVNLNSKFTVGNGQEFDVYNYSGPLEFLPHLYRYLINGEKHFRDPITVVFDAKAKALALYNKDKSLRLRITTHEYSRPEKLHLHLNEMRTGTIVNQQGQEVEETVNFNLSIPIAKPASLPNYKRDEYLYKQFIQNPVNFYRGDKRVTILQQPIF